MKKRNIWMSMFLSLTKKRADYNYYERSWVNSNLLSGDQNIRFAIFLGVFMLLPSYATAQHYNRIIIRTDSHPAICSAAEILAMKMHLCGENIVKQNKMSIPKGGEILLVDTSLSEELVSFVGSKASAIKHDGYMIAFHNGGVLVFGKRPRSLLYAVGDYNLWKDRKSGKYIREPSFAIRSSNYEELYSDRMNVAELVAHMGVNQLYYKKMEGNSFVTLEKELPEIYDALSSQQQKQITANKEDNIKKSFAFAEECKKADIPYYAFLYGNDFQRWSPEVTKAVYKVYPQVKGVRAPYTLETAVLCPSESMTWKVIEAYLKEFIEVSARDAEGVITTFWDWYGIHCQCDLCKSNGLDQFSNQLYEYVNVFFRTLKATDKRLIVRTWASGCSYWGGWDSGYKAKDSNRTATWVSGPGYGNFTGTNLEFWGRVVDELPAEITLQTKVYYSDCQPNSRFNPMIGRLKPHSQIVEYQMSGQTRGRYLFPASEANHTTWSMRKTYELIGPKGGVHNFFGPYVGRYASPDYMQMDDIANSINLYIWKQLSWDINAKTDELWKQWAIPIYCKKASPYIIKALQLSESAVDTMYSTLGLGGNNEGEFCTSVAQKEMFLKFTNRYYLPEYARHLQPTRDNIELVLKEKLECLRKIDKMFELLGQAKPHMTGAQYEELRTRFDWLKQFSTIRRHLDESYWRFRYLRHLNTMRTTDPEQMCHIVKAYDEVQKHKAQLFRYRPDLKFSCYSKELRDLKIKPYLGDPMLFMQDIYDQSKFFVEDIVGPSYLPESLRR